ncbi:MAG: hypothetical protein OQJ80_09960 [Kangiella sp.]|nr:hypothetical protein [Kangiella sp.]
MEFQLKDILTILALIVTFIGLLIGVLKWALSELNKQSASANKSLEKVMTENYQQMTNTVRELKNEFHQNKNKHEERLNKIANEHWEFKAYVADKYVKKENWLEHAVSLERKVERIGNLLSKEYKDLFHDVSDIKGFINSLDKQSSGDKK